MTRAINFSGGRSSAMMLYMLLKQGLNNDDHIIFTNTGMEREETLEFVQDCSDYWSVPIVWVEYAGEKQYKLVDYESASRKGEPFQTLVEENRYLPNRVARFCTGDLKVKACKWYMQQQVGASYWHSALGIRYDEPLRWGKMLQQKQRDPWFVELPLYEAKITVEDVAAFWVSQPFDLGIQSHQGNCTLCFLKGKRKLVTLIRENPSVIDWWIEREKECGSTFSAKHSYTELKQLALNQKVINFTAMDDVDYPCHCNAD